jgi:hypothetical protein
MRLSQENASKLATLCKKDPKGACDKLKASNFPGSVLKIGTWEVYLISTVFLDSIQIKTMFFFFFFACIVLGIDF